MKKYYIASGLENAAAVRELKQILDAAGWHHTYDWTVHGSVYGEGADRLAEVAAAESAGVIDAEVVVALLPGGRGTHTELGMAIACGEFDIGTEDRVRICVYSATPEKDFGTNGTTCAFYHHPLVERFSDMSEMINSLLGAS